MKKIFVLLGFMLALWISSCKQASAHIGECDTDPTTPVCETLFTAYENLRMLPVDLYLDYEGRKFEEGYNQHFSTLANDAKHLSPCLALPAKSYGNYFQAVEQSNKERKIIYPTKNQSKIDKSLLKNCDWDLGESSIILMDQILSGQYKIKSEEDLKQFTIRLNKTELQENLACFFMLTSVRDTISLYDEMPETGTIIDDTWKTCSDQTELEFSQYWLRHELLSVLEDTFKNLDDSLNNQKNIIRQIFRELPGTEGEKDLVFIPYPEDYEVSDFLDKIGHLTLDCAQSNITNHAAQIAMCKSNYQDIKNLASKYSPLSHDEKNFVQIELGMIMHEIARKSQDVSLPHCESYREFFVHVSNLQSPVYDTFKPVFSLRYEAISELKFCE